MGTFDGMHSELAREVATDVKRAARLMGPLEGKITSLLSGAGLSARSTYRPVAIAEDLEALALDIDGRLDILNDGQPDAPAQSSSPEGNGRATHLASVGLKPAGPDPDPGDPGAGGGKKAPSPDPGDPGGKRPPPSPDPDPGDHDTPPKKKPDPPPKPDPKPQPPPKPSPPPGDSGDGGDGEKGDKGDKGGKGDEEGKKRGGGPEPDGPEGRIDGSPKGIDPPKGIDLPKGQNWDGRVSNLDEIIRAYVAGFRDGQGHVGLDCDWRKPYKILPIEVGEEDSHRGDGPGRARRMGDWKDRFGPWTGKDGSKVWHPIKLPKLEGYPPLTGR